MSERGVGKDWERLFSPEKQSSRTLQRVRVTAELKCSNPEQRGCFLGATAGEKTENSDPKILPGPSYQQANMKWLQVPLVT